MSASTLLVKLTAHILLKTTAEQQALLRQTLRRENEACNWLSARAFETKTFKRFALHKVAYRECRERFPDLASNAILMCIAKVANSYTRTKHRLMKFSPLGSIGVNCQLMRWRKNTISIWSLAGRITIPWVCKKEVLRRLTSKHREHRLFFREGKFYLAATVDVEENPLISTGGVVGVDLGIKNIATTSTGDNYAGAQLNSLRIRMNKLRSKLQSLGTRSAKRLLRKLRRKEGRFSHHTNHVISKRIVESAKRTERAIGLENLQGIGTRQTASRALRRLLHSWAFYDLQKKIEYKAQLAGIPVIYVDPRYSSQECHFCRHVSKKNRISRDWFVCQECGMRKPADHNAACVIACRAAVNQPYAARDDGTVGVGAQLRDAVLANSVSL